MKNNINIGWDISHQEFTIEDHYYFSSLKKEIIQAGSLVEEVKQLKDILDYDVAVLNYPEKSFNKKEILIINKFLKSGGRVIVTGYYNNEDYVADCVNSLTYDYGLVLRKDQIRDKVQCYGKDELLIITDGINAYNSGVKKVMFPCCSSVKLLKKKSTPFVVIKGCEGNRSKIIGAQILVEGGCLILIGTCVFWDNYAISKYSNLKFSLNLLLN